MRRATLAVLAIAAAAMSACASVTPSPPHHRTARVSRTERPPQRIDAPAPARGSCVPRSLSAKPRYPDTDAALRGAPGAADRYQLMAAGRLLRQKRLDQLEQVVDACR
jgi:hypothetical protein